MSFFTTASTSTDFDKPEDIHRHPTTGISVLIVGAGPVGLYTALECWRKGHNVLRVLERSPVPSAAGDSFSVNGWHITTTWPALGRALDQASLTDMSLSFHKLTGERVAGPEEFDLLKKSHGRLANDGTAGPTTVYRASRPKFTAALLGQAAALGIPVDFGSRVVEYFENASHAGVVLDDGSRLVADVVVAADGVGTKSHKLVAGHESRAMTSGFSIFRTAYRREYVDKAGPEVAARFAPDEVNGKTRAVFELWSGKGLSMSVARRADHMEWTITHKDIHHTAQESWHHFTTGVQVSAYLATHFPEVPDSFRQLVLAAPDGSIVDWQLLWRDPQPCTVSPLGRVVQAGDSAHTFVPSSGSGVNQGLEDAVTLATCLQLGGGSSALWARVHEKLRFERVSCCQYMGFVNQSHYLNPEWGQNALEDSASKVRPEYGWWILGHNPEHYAYENYGKAARHLLEGTPFTNTNIPPGFVYKPWTLQEITDALERGEKLKLEGDWS